MNGSTDGRIDGISKIRVLDGDAAVQLVEVKSPAQDLKSNQFTFYLTSFKKLCFDIIAKLKNNQKNMF